MRAYCEPCGPGPCYGECCLGDEALQCDHCDTWHDPDTVAQCWACNSVACSDCIDAHGFPCAHYSERTD